MAKREVKKRTKKSLTKKVGRQPKSKKALPKKMVKSTRGSKIRKK